MGYTELKPVKINLNNGTASGMYILLNKEEIKYTKDNETRPPNRIYKIQIGVEAIYQGRRCRGKHIATIPRGTSISKAVSSLLGKREEMKATLKSKGTLKTEKKMLQQIDTKDRRFESIYDAWIESKKINHSKNTIKIYDSCYRNHLTGLKRKIIDDFTEDDIQNIINKMINDSKSPSTINTIKMIMKPLLQLHDVQLNWRKIVLPKNDNKRTFKGDDNQAKLIAQTLLNYKHPIARGVFVFLLSGRRINETLQLEHSHINYHNNTFTLPAEITKTKTEVTFTLTPLMKATIKAQKTTKGKVFNMVRESCRYHFLQAMSTIGVHNMVMHDLRSMVAVTALRNGADLYSVSKMLAHKLISTTEKNYLGDGTERAIEAQETFASLIGVNDGLIDVDVIEDEFTALKKIYPDASDDKIRDIIEMMK